MEKWWHGVFFILPFLRRDTAPPSGQTSVSKLQNALPHSLPAGLQMTCLVDHLLFKTIFMSWETANWLLVNIYYYTNWIQKKVPPWLVPSAFYKKIKKKKKKSHSIVLHSCINPVFSFIPKSQKLWFHAKKTKVNTYSNQSMNNRSIINSSFKK